MILADILLLIILNLVMMAVLFVVGIQQFQKISDKPKGQANKKLALRRRFALSDFNINEEELRQLVRDEAYDLAIQRLMAQTDIDRFAAESAIESLKKEAYRPYYKQDSQSLSDETG